jgi:hypothetical protein
MTIGSQLLNLAQIETAPPEPGIYAWYYVQVITERDLRDLNDGLLKEEDEAKRRKLLQNFLLRNVFRAFVSPPYDAEMKGPLAPLFSGQLEHHQEVSESLLDRLCAAPERLRAIKRVLEAAVPEFASPIYIGMTDNLRRRLCTHKSLIERYRAAEVFITDASSTDDETKRDHSFAREVSERKFSVNGLRVAIRSIEGQASEQADVENVLNRINFPICGRK